MKRLTLSFLLMFLTLVGYAHTAFYVLRPYKVINDTLLTMLDDYLFSEDVHPNRQMEIYINKHDSIVYVSMYIRTYEGASLLSNLKEMPLGYVRYRNKNIIVFSNVKEGYFERDRSRNNIQIPSKNLLPFDGYIGWRLSINQMTGIVSLLEHITGW